jgi:hypothetical protein
MMGSHCGAARGDAPVAGPRVEGHGDSIHIESGKNVCRLMQRELFFSETSSNIMPGMPDLKYLYRILSGDVTNGYHQQLACNNMSCFTYMRTAAHHHMSSSVYECYM